MTPRRGLRSGPSSETKLGGQVASGLLDSGNPAHRRQTGLAAGILHLKTKLSGEVCCETIEPILESVRRPDEAIAAAEANPELLGHVERCVDLRLRDQETPREASAALRRLASSIFADDEGEGDIDMTAEETRRVIEQERSRQTIPRFEPGPPRRRRRQGPRGSRPPGPSRRELLDFLGSSP